MAYPKSYKYYNNPKSIPEECAITYFRKGNFVVQQKKTNIEFYIYNSVKEFYNMYINLHPIERNFSEVIPSGKQKFRLDIDGILNHRELKKLIKIIHKIFIKIKPDLITESQIIVYDIKTSYHIVVSGVAFESPGCCSMVSNLIMEKVNEKIPRIVPFIDMDTYKSLQMLRLEGSTKYLNYRWKYVLGYDKISTLKSFKKGLISYTKNCITVDTDLVVQLALDLGIYYSSLPTLERYNSTESIVSNINLYDDNIFTKREVRGNMTILNRVRPSFCKECQRIHENENPYMVNGKIYCRRKLWQ